MSYKVMALLAVSLGFAFNVTAADTSMRSASLAGCGRYVFGSIDNSGNQYLLDTESGRLWKMSNEKGMQTMQPVLFKTLDHNIKLQPEDGDSVVRQEMKLQIEQQKLSQQRNMQSQKNDAVKKAIMSYAKFIKRTELLQHEIGKLLKSDTLDTNKEALVKKSIESQKVNIGKTHEVLKKMLVDKDLADISTENRNVLNTMSQQLANLSEQCHSLEVRVLSIKGDREDPKVTESMSKTGEKTH